jgi:hypothetical protein
MTPKIEFAFLAEYAMAPDNQLSAISMIDFVAIKKFPEITSFYLAGILFLQTGIIYKSEIRIVSSTNGNKKGGICIKSEPGTFDLLDVQPSGSKIKIALAIPLRNIKFEFPGKYSVEIIIDNLCIHTIDLDVRQDKLFLVK